MARTTIITVPATFLTEAHPGDWIDLAGTTRQIIHVTPRRIRLDDGTTIPRSHT